MTSLNVQVRVPAAIADYPPGTAYGPRLLADFELVWLIAGSARWQSAGRELGLVPGQVLLIPPGTRDAFRWDPTVTTRHGYVHFTLHGSPPPLPGAAGWLRCRDAGPLTGLLDYLVWLAGEAAPESSARAEEVLSLLVRMLVDGPFPPPVTPGLPPPVAAALTHVREAWRTGPRPVSLGELAAAASVSKAHLAREFMRTFGLAAVAGLDLVRLSRAATLLQRTNLTVAQVGAACGFADPLHFSRRFRSAYGHSPRAYRSAGGEPPDLANAVALRRLERIVSEGEPARP